MRDWATRRSPATLIKWAVLAMLVAGGIWAFSSGTPNQDAQLQVALRSAGDEQVELALYSTDHTGEALLHVPTNNILDLSQPRERRTYSDPIELPGSAPKAMVSVLSDSQYEFALGARVQKPNRAWSSSRFASREHLSRAEWESDRLGAARAAVGAGERESAAAGRCQGGLLHVVRAAVRRRAHAVCLAPMVVLSRSRRTARFCPTGGAGTLWK